MARVSTEIEQRLQEDQAAVELLDTVPGISQRGAEILLAEIGADLSRLPSSKHLASWAGMCPGNKRVGAISGNNTLGITLSGEYAALIRSSGPAPKNSIGILTSDPFVGG